ncbi:MAG: hypothetical protein ACMUIU_14065 [bacterium]
MSFKAVLKNSIIIFFFIFLGIFLSVNICNAQYLPFNYGTPYGTGSGSQNIPVITPFMRINVDSINFYSPYGYGTNSSSPYSMGGLYGPYGGGLYGGFYGFYGRQYGGFYGLYGGLYGMGNLMGPGLFGAYGFGGLGIPWFF